MRSSWIAVLLSSACAVTPKGVPVARELASEEDVAAFVNGQVEELKPLVLASNRAWWHASVTGSDEAWDANTAAEDALNRFWADPGRFATIQAARSGDLVTDPMLRRHLDILYRGALGKQVDPATLEKLTALNSEVERIFNNYRGEVNGEQVTDNDINRILRSSKDPGELEAAWRAQKGVGAAVAPTLRELVAARNDIAHALGFRDYFELRLAEQELDEGELIALYDELDRLTREPFVTAKAEVDRRLAERYGIEVSALEPWHYHNPFFQEPPDVFDTGLGALYEKADPLEVCKQFYDSIGLEVRPILERSDLYEKPGKTQHAYSADIDRAGDVRVIANVVPGFEWLSTMVHELGHAVYSANHGADLPWLLRDSAHSLTTEGVAMMLDRLAGNPLWAHALGLISAEQRDATLPEARAERAFASLVFSRWAQVMLRFERAMYADPDQDLNDLWWDLVETYQGLRRPEGRDQPDYASKMHVVSYPVYYQNYMLGELFSAQVHEKLAEIEGVPPAEAVYVDKKEIGAYLRERIFAPGESLPWRELVEQATGAPLSARAFARRFGG